MEDECKRTRGGVWTARSGFPERGAANVLAKLQPKGKFMLATLFRSSKLWCRDQRWTDGQQTVRRVTQLSQTGPGRRSLALKDD